MLMRSPLPCKQLHRKSKRGVELPKWNYEAGRTRSKTGVVMNRHLSFVCLGPLRRCACLCACDTAGRSLPWPPSCLARLCALRPRDPALDRAQPPLVSQVAMLWERPGGEGWRASRSSRDAVLGRPPLMRKRLMRPDGGCSSRPVALTAR